MILKSYSFRNNAEIPRTFTCDGANHNPSLIIEDIPSGTQSLLLIVDDPDATGGRTFTHWLVWNISPEIGKIRENSVPENAIQGRNSWGVNYYRGPKPPSGTHRYFFRIFAINAILGLDKGANKQEVESAIKNHILDKAELIGLYR